MVWLAQRHPAAPPQQRPARFRNKLISLCRYWSQWPAGSRTNTVAASTRRLALSHQWRWPSPRRPYAPSASVFRVKINRGNNFGDWDGKSPWSVGSAAPVDSKEWSKP